VMIGQNLCVGFLPQPPQHHGRALDVGEEKRESLHRQSVKAIPGG
jgi:hypothetical protein